MSSPAPAAAAHAANDESDDYVMSLMGTSTNTKVDIHPPAIDSSEQMLSLLTKAGVSLFSVMHDGSGGPIVVAAASQEQVEAVHPGALIVAFEPDQPFAPWTFITAAQAEKSATTNAVVKRIVAGGAPPTEAELAIMNSKPRVVKRKAEEVAVTATEEPETKKVKTDDEEKPLVDVALVIAKRVGYENTYLIKVSSLPDGGVAKLIEHASDWRNAPDAYTCAVSDARKVWDTDDSQNFMPHIAGLRTVAIVQMDTLAAAVDAPATKTDDQEKPPIDVVLVIMEGSGASGVSVIKVSNLPGGGVDQLVAHSYGWSRAPSEYTQAVSDAPTEWMDGDSSSFRPPGAGLHIVAVVPINTD